jgi:hypothetical protein
MSRSLEAWSEVSSVPSRNHFGLGKLYGCTGRREQAHEHLTIALAMYREMDVRFWLEQVEAEIGA